MTHTPAQRKPRNEVASSEEAWAGEQLELWVAEEVVGVEGLEVAVVDVAAVVSKLYKP